MWLFTKDGGFISVVAHDTDPDLVRVHARKHDHLVWSFPGATVIEMPDADYRWHADVSRGEMVEMVTDAVLDLNYPSHVKEEVSGDDDEMYRAMLDCWQALHRLQIGG